MGGSGGPEQGSARGGAWHEGSCGRARALRESVGTARRCDGLREHGARGNIRRQRHFRSPLPRALSAPRLAAKMMRRQRTTAARREPPPSVASPETVRAAPLPPLGLGRHAPRFSACLTVRPRSADAYRACSCRARARCWCHAPSAAARTERRGEAAAPASAARLHGSEAALGSTGRLRFHVRAHEARLCLAAGIRLSRRRAASTVAHGLSPALHATHADVQGRAAAICGRLAGGTSVAWHACTLQLQQRGLRALVGRERLEITTGVGL